ncbi:MAG: NAD(P)H-hydrate dehydratase, partial [Phenylobacterium sp.]|uniref:NAD(P)H-hydrate dehydratase n=1 Tax=Phenylobacterium sp. TaxID=1871053 RepID=UPI002735D9F2
LTGVAALRAGAGKLQLAATAGAALAMGLAVPEAAVVAVAADAAGELAAEAAKDLEAHVGRAHSVVVGPGMADEAAAAELACRLMRQETQAAFVIDAAAMTGLDLHAQATRTLGGRLVLTPHAGEMASLTGWSKQAVADAPLEAARLVAQALHAIVVMKGEETFIVSPDGRAWSHAGGVIGLATSGSGDVLAGVIAGLLARGASPLAAAVWGVCLHGGAGARLSQRIGPLGFLARELPAEIPGLLADAGANV